MLIELCLILSITRYTILVMTFLPVVLSSRIKGWEVENYLRRNLAIKAYDLIGT